MRLKIMNDTQIFSACNVFHDYQNLKIDKNLFSETRWDPKKTDKDNSRKSAFNILAFVYLLSN